MTFKIIAPISRFEILRDSYTAGFYGVFFPDHASGHQKSPYAM